MIPTIESKQSLIRYATYLAVAVACVLVVAKFIAWIMSDSISVLSSLVDSLLDLLASTCNLLAVRYAFTPADEDHRFGHGKAESLIAVAQSAFITGSAVFVLFEASQHLVNVRTMTGHWYGIASMVLSMTLTVGLLSFQRYVVSKTQSVAINADALHYKGDILMNAGVIIALLLTYYLQIHYIDVILGSLIAIYLLVNAWKIIANSLDHLMDKELPDDKRQQIIDIAKSHPKVLDIHDLRTRRSGLVEHIQLHIEMNGQMTLTEAHDIAEEVEELIFKDFPDADIIIHQDPHGVDEVRQDELLKS